MRGEKKTQTMMWAMDETYCLQAYMQKSPPSCWKKKKKARTALKDNSHCWSESESNKTKSSDYKKSQKPTKTEHKESSKKKEKLLKRASIFRVRSLWGSD